MMKRSLVLIQFMLCASLALAASEPREFMGVSWEAHINTLGETTQIGNDRWTVMVTKKDENLTRGNVDLSHISYSFYNDRFYCGYIEARGWNNCQQLLDVLIQKYGEPRQPNRFMKKFIWEWDRVSVFYSFSEITTKGQVMYLHKPTKDRLDREKKNQARSNSGGF